MSKYDPYEHWNIRIEEDGSCTRLISVPKIPATSDEAEAAQANESVVTKDVTLNPDKKTWIRIFRPAKLPANDQTVARLPILVYLHGGGWLMFNIDDVMVHMNCAQFCESLPAIMLSVDYRLAPESRLPTQYDDVLDSLTWLKNNTTEPWIKDYGDMSRVYLYGVSNGGNIAFHTALRALDVDLSPLRLSGIVLNQPMFGGKYRTKSELKYATDQLLPLPALDAMWELTLPKGTDRDHRYCNPMAEGVRDKVGRLGRCLVIGFGGDPMVDRQQEFVQMLVRAGVRVEARFDDVGFHGVDLVDPRRASVVINLVREFI